MGEKMVDKVTRIMKNPESIRNIAICAHIDHGKTTFSDNLLAGAGMMSEELAGKALQLDFREDEQARGITIDTAAVSMAHEVGGQDFLGFLVGNLGIVEAFVLIADHGHVGISLLLAADTAGVTLESFQAMFKTRPILIYPGKPTGRTLMNMVAEIPREGSPVLYLTPDSPNVYAHARFTF